MLGRFDLEGTIQRVGLKSGHFGGPFVRGLRAKSFALKNHVGLVHNRSEPPFLGNINRAGCLLEKGPFLGETKNYTLASAIIVSTETSSADLGDCYCLVVRLWV